MGRFTAFREDVYPRSQLTTFPAAGTFTIESAQALAWAAQVAYETADEPKLDRILTGWGWQRDAILGGDVSEALPFTLASGFAAHVGRTTVVAFAGTEPDSATQWLENFSALPVDGMHKGFKAGIDAVWKKKRLPDLIDAAAEIYFCGHSLGGALAVAAARRLCSEMPNAAVKIRGVYTMGMPRVGTEPFARTYNGTPLAPQSSLGQQTFRLVHGDDIVPHLPPTVFPFGYRHVGRALACPQDGNFSAGSLGPVAIEGASGEGALNFSNTVVPELTAPPFPADDPLVVKLAAALPAIIRGHLMDRYLRALGAM